MARSHFVVFWWKIHGRLMESMVYTPENLTWNMEPKHEGLGDYQDYCPFQFLEFQVIFLCSPWFTSMVNPICYPFVDVVFCFSWYQVLYWRSSTGHWSQRFIFVCVDNYQITAKMIVYKTVVNILPYFIGNIQPKHEQKDHCPMRHFGGFHLIFAEGVSSKWCSRRIFLISWVPQDHILELGHKEFPWHGLPWCYSHTSLWLHDLCLGFPSHASLLFLFCEKRIPQYMLEQSDVDLAGGGESILCMLGEFPDVASMVDLFSTVNPGFYYLRI